MKNIYLLFFLSLIISFHARAQFINSSGASFQKYQAKVAARTTRPRALFSNTTRTCIDNPVIGTQYNIKMSTFSIPATFNSINIKNGKYSLGSTLNLGVGYTWINGKAIYNQDQTIQVQPGIFYGLGVNTGVLPDPGGTGLNGALSGNVFIGFSSVAIDFGYDIINKNTFFGLATKIDIFTFGGSDIFTVNCLWSNPVPRH